MDLLTYALQKKSESIINDVIKNIANMVSFQTEVVAELPITGSEGVLYFAPADASNENDTYDEFVFINNKWERVGSTKVDLANYLRSDEIAAWAKQSTKPTYTKAEVGLNNVDNTADIDKPVSTATQTALNAKQNILNFDTITSDAVTKGYVDNLFNSIRNVNEVSY